MGLRQINDDGTGLIYGLDAGKRGLYGVDGGTVKDLRLAFMVGDGGLYV